MHRWRMAVAVGGLLLLLAGCGDDGDEAEAEAGGETLQDFLGMGGDPEDVQATMEDQQRQVEEHVAECMAEEGFDYVPRDPFTGSSVESSPRADMTEEEFREEYGFGISTVEREEAMAEDTAAAPADPNLELQQEMDDAERQAYQEALHGPPPDIDPDADPDEPVMREAGGCRAEAQEEVQSPQRRLQEELGDELQAMYERLQSDPRVVEAEEGWAQCMRDAGWEFSERNEAFQHISDQMNELRQDAQPDPEEMAEFEAEFDPEAEDFEPPPMPEPDPEALAELQDEEMELAEADWDCTVEHIGEDYGVYTEVQEEYEGEFIEEHRELLEEIRE